MFLDADVSWRMLGVLVGMVILDHYPGNLLKCSSMLYHVIVRCFIVLCI